MKQGELNLRLSKINTSWSALREAHTGSADAVTAAQQLLIERYGGAVRRYLLAAVRDPVTADDLSQEFALALMRGEFRKADPQRGRFRDYVKGVLFHLVSKYRRQQRRQPAALTGDSADMPVSGLQPEELDATFVEGWRDQLLARAWTALADTQPTYYAVLRFRSQNPDLASAEMAEKLSEGVGKSFTAASVRQTLHRARELFADLLLVEVAQSVEPPTAEQIEQELRELDLWTYCQTALERRTNRG